MNWLKKKNGISRMAEWINLIWAKNEINHIFFFYWQRNIWQMTNKENLICNYSQLKNKNISSEDTIIYIMCFVMILLYIIHRHNDVCKFYKFIFVL